MKLNYGKIAVLPSEKYMDCPSCGSVRVYPSRLRNLVERLRQTVTDKQPVRCHNCGWRRWRDVTVHEDHAPVRPDDLRTGRTSAAVSTTELEQLDSAAPRSR
jgi:DNA-directed RNA polymerase subunit RPC12/RpoP